MASSRQDRDGAFPHAADVTPERAFDEATLDLAMEGIRIDAERVQPLAGYRDGVLDYAQACRAMRARHPAG